MDETLPSGHGLSAGRALVLLALGCALLIWSATQPSIEARVVGGADLASLRMIELGWGAAFWVAIVGVCAVMGLGVPRDARSLASGAMGVAVALVVAAIVAVHHGWGQRTLAAAAGMILAAAVSRLAGGRANPAVLAGVCVIGPGLALAIAGVDEAVMYGGQDGPLGRVRAVDWAAAALIGSVLGQWWGASLMEQAEPSAANA